MQPPGRFGALDLAVDRVVQFRGKPAGGDAWIDGGFDVLSCGVIDHDMLREQEPLQRPAADDEPCAWRSPATGNRWTRCEKTQLEELRASGRAPWKVWS